VFKAAIFDPASSLADVAGRASDNQRSGQFGEEISGYFLRFLGCRHRQDPARETAAFVDHVQNFLNSAVPADNRAAVQTAMLAELASSDETIDPVDFATKYLPGALRDQFLAPFADADGSVGVITKDDSLIDATLGKIVYVFEDGLILTGLSDVMQRDVTYDAQLGAWIIRSDRTEVTAKAPFRRTKR
jgi:hypothetical protein